MRSQRAGRVCVCVCMFRFKEVRKKGREEEEYLSVSYKDTINVSLASLITTSNCETL